MQTDVRLPQLAGEMTAARLSVWLKHEGEAVVAGEPIVEFETDKTNVELEAPASGILQGIRIVAGTDGVPVGALLAVIADAGSAVAPAPVPDPPRAPEPRRDGSRAAAAAESRAQVVPRIAPPAADDVATPPPGDAGDAAEVRATPLATRMAALAAIDLRTVRASGADGTVTKADVDVHLGRSRRPPDERITPAVVPATGAGTSGYRDVPLSAMRRSTAARLQDAKRTIPHFYLQTECRVDALLAMRTELNAKLDDVKVSVTDFVVFAAVHALRRVPGANAMWNGDGVRLFDDIDVCVAVNTPKGLITPVIRRAQTKSLTALARELKSAAVRARAGALMPEEYTGGTFTISNLGMFAVTGVVPIINPPQACILGIGSIEHKPVVVGDAIRPGSVMTCTLAADHRAIDGATGAELLGELRRLLEEPVLLALRA